MEKFENGIAWYETETATVPVYFPEGHIACQYCKLFCRYKDGFKRYSCRLTDEWLIDPMRNIGFNCPLKFKE